MPANPSFDSLASLTIRNIIPDVIDNFTDNNALFFQLGAYGMIDRRKGGLSIQQPIALSRNSTFTSFAGSDTLPLLVQDPFSSAEFLWKQFAVTLSLNNIDIFKNGAGNKEQIVPYLQSMVQNANDSLRLGMNAQLYADGTGNSGKDLTGLALAVEDGAVWSTYAGIDSSAAAAANQRWRNAWIGTIGSFAANGRRNVTTLFNNTFKDGEYPTINVTVQAIYEAYEASLTVNEKFEMTNLRDEALVNAGFEHLMFKNRPVIWDTDCTAASWYVLNAMHLKLAVGQDIEPPEFLRSKNQDTRSCIIPMYAQLYTDARNRHGVANGITTP